MDSDIGESTDRIADNILQSIELLKQEVPSKTMVIILRVEYVIQKFDINFYNLYTWLSESKFDLDDDCIVYVLVDWYEGNFQDRMVWVCECYKTFCVFKKWLWMIQIKN